MAPKPTKYGTDGYKMSMGQVFWWMNMVQNLNIRGLYKFVDRNDNRFYDDKFLTKLRKKVEDRASLPSDPNISNYMSSRWDFANQEYLRWYDKVFFHNPDEVHMSTKDGRLELYVDGPIHTATHHEIPLLRDISCITKEVTGRTANPDWRKHAEDRARFLYENKINHSEGGGRRPFDEDTHWEALHIHAKHRKNDSGDGNFLGTSWIEYAYQLNLMVMGTMAHEYIQLMAGIYGYKNANKMALKTWVDHFGRRLGYYLTDTYTTEVALRDFTGPYATYFEGTRNDSQKYDLYVDQMLQHYESINVQADKKSVIHSNSLPIDDRLLDIKNYKPGTHKTANLFGGSITNNVGFPAHNTVIKLVAVKVGISDWNYDVVKLSDDPAKSIGKTKQHIINCREELGLPVF